MNWQSQFGLDYQSWPSQSQQAASGGGPGMTASGETSLLSAIDAIFAQYNASTSPYASLDAFFDALDANVLEDLLADLAALQW